MYNKENYRCTIPFSYNGLNIEGEYNTDDIIKIVPKRILDAHGYFYSATEPAEPEEYIPSCTAGDYSPSNPWDAPGMSVRDFI